MKIRPIVMPLIVERRAEVENLQKDLQGRCYDLEYSLRYALSLDLCISVTLWALKIVRILTSKFFIFFYFSAIKSVDKADEPFKNIQELLKSAIFLKQQLKSDETKRRPSTASGGSNSSVYKRLSGEWDKSQISPKIRFSS